MTAGAWRETRERGGSDGEHRTTHHRRIRARGFAPITFIHIIHIVWNINKEKQKGFLLFFLLLSPYVKRHFGWHVTDARASLATFKTRPDVTLLPLYTTDAGGSVLISSDTWPGTGGVPGRTAAQIEQAKRDGIQPAGGGGFAYMTGPDNALVEIAGNYPTERFNHVHLWQEDPLCALLWYQKHLNAPVRAGVATAAVTEANCKVPPGAERSWPSLGREGMFRSPRAGVEFGDVVLTWYPNQGDQPLAPSRGQLQDHIGLSVTDLDAWVAKLESEGVVFLTPIYPVGDTRAVMIEGPSKEVLELIALP